MDIEIRLATLNDAHDMAEVHKRSWEVAYQDIIPADFIREKNAGRQALWERVLAEENTTQYIIKQQEKTLGMIGVDVSGDEDVEADTYELLGLYLLPEYFHQGVGKQAMEFAFNKALGLGMKVIKLWVLQDNYNARRFYEKCGFVGDGNTRELNYGKTLKAVRMSREL